MSKKNSKKKWDYKQWTLLTRALCLVGAVLLLVRLFTDTTTFVLPGVIFLVVGMVIAAVKVNCPYCGNLIADLLTHNSTKCPHCGKPLEPIFPKKGKK